MIRESSGKKILRSDSGHYKNLANLSILIESIKSYGPLYNPSSNSLTISYLEMLKEDIFVSISAVRDAEIALNKAVQKRLEAYEGMYTLAERMHSAMAPFAVKKEIFKAKSYLRKMRGCSKKKKMLVACEKSKLTSRMTFDGRMSCLRDFCTFLETVEAYKPPEAELRPAYILAHITGLGAHNYNVNKAWSDLIESRAELDRLLYSGVTGALDIAKGVRNYIINAFGKRSMEYKRISRIEFVKH